MRTCGTKQDVSCLDVSVDAVFAVQVRQGHKDFVQDICHKRFI